MIFRLRIAFAVLWLCCSVAMSAQISFSLPFINDATPGSNKSMTVQVTNFDSIVSMQYVIRWNPAVLKYITIDNFALPGLNLPDFNVLHAVDSGYIRLLWEGPNSYPGVSVADETAIYRLRFNVIGADTSSTPVKFTEIDNTFPTISFEIVKAVTPTVSEAFDETECALTNGFVAVGFTVAANEPSATDALALSVSPNPFTDHTSATFYLEQTTDVQLLVNDATGRQVFQKEMLKLPSGKQTIDFDKAIFPAKGAYFLTIRAGSQTSARAMICY